MALASFFILLIQIIICTTIFIILKNIVIVYRHIQHLHTHTHTFHSFIHSYIHTVHACIHAYIHVCMHACIHTCIHTSIHTSMHTYIQLALRSIVLFAEICICRVTWFQLCIFLSINSRIFCCKSRIFFLESRVCAVVLALAFHQCGPG